MVVFAKIATHCRIQTNSVAASPRTKRPEEANKGIVERPFNMLPGHASLC